MTDDLEPQTKRVRKYAWALAAFWTVVVAASLLWNVNYEKHQILKLARTQARAAHEKDVLYRRWNAEHGGVYVPITEETPPNPYLDVPERDITTPSGKALTLVNPAYMTRQVHELGHRRSGVRGHITSLKPLRPGNAPDAWEAEALEAFERGETEISSIESIDGREYLRLMRPLVTEEGCLKCHAAQGYKVGDIRGGISASVPLAPLRAIGRTHTVGEALCHGLFWLVGLGAIAVATRHVNRQVDPRDRLEARLLESEGWLKTVVGASMDAMISIDPDGLITLFNPAAERMFGRSASEMLGRKVDCLMPEQYRAQHGQGASAFLMDGTSSGVIGQTVELPALRRDGTEFPVELSLSSGEHGEQRFVLASIRDITLRKKAEEKLARIQAAVDDATDAVLIVEQNGKVSYVNMAFVDLFNCTIETANEEGWDCLFVDHGIAKEILAAANDLNKWNGDVEMISRQGRTFPAEVRAAPIVGEGALTSGVVLFIDDVTQRKEAEAVEHERNSLKQAVAGMEQVLGVVGHELRTPLAGLRAISEFLLTDGARETAEFDGFLKNIHEEVVRMTGMVNDMLEAARLNSGTARWNWATVSVAKACNEALDTVRPLVDPQHVALVCDVAPPDATLSGDADAVRRLVVNLVNNAAKHTRAGSIRVEARAQTDAEGRWVEIRVQDTGEGISADAAARLGTAFALNAGVVGAQHVRGTGLGLAICKGIAAAHGGAITVESASGQGTTVIVRLRADLAEPAAVTGEAEIVRKVVA